MFIKFKIYSGFSVLMHYNIMQILLNNSLVVLPSFLAPEL